MLRARAAERRGRRAQAQRLLRRALALAQDSVSPAMELARFLAEAGRLGEARKTLAEACRRKPSASALMAWARLCERAGERSEAERLFSAAAAIAPDSAEPHYERGRLLERAGRSPEADGAYRAALAIEPTHVQALVALARLSTRGPRESRALWEQAAAGSGGLARFSALMNLGRYIEAFAEGERLLRRGGGMLDLAVLWRPWDDTVPTAAWRRRLAALEALPASARRGGWAALYACVARYHLGHWRVAADLALPRSRSRAWMKVWRGRTRLLLMRFEAAAADFGAARSGRPTHWYADAWLAETLLCAGRRSEAFAAMDAARPAAVRAGGQAYWCAWRGKLCLWAGRWGEAERFLSEAARAGSAYAPAWRGAARLLAGRLEEAALDLDEAARVRPGDYEVWLWRAELALRRGRPQDALAELKAAGVGKGGGPWVDILGGLAARAAGRTGALAAWRRLAPWEQSAFRGEGRAPQGEEEAAGLLECVRARAGGVRRHESYIQRVWLGRRR